MSRSLIAMVGLLSVGACVRAAEQERVYKGKTARGRGILLADTKFE
jgi:hypothetical protein